MPPPRRKGATHHTLLTAARAAGTTAGGRLGPRRVRIEVPARVIAAPPPGRSAGGEQKADLGKLAKLWSEQDGLVVDLHDAPENLGTTGCKEPDHGTVLSWQRIEELVCLLETGPGPLNEPFHHDPPFLEKRLVWCVSDLDGVLHSGFEIRDVMTFGWNVDPVAFFQITSGVLPVIGQLQGGADGITAFQRNGIVILVRQSQNQPTDGIGTSPAVVDERIPGRVSRHALILLKCIDQIQKRFRPEPVAIDLRGQGNKDRMGGFSILEAGEGLRSPPRQQFQALFGALDLVAQIVCPPAECIDDRSSISHRFRHHP